MLDARDLPDGQRLSADVCIVGAGAVGISMALEFVGTGIDVLLVESGGIEVSAESEDQNVGTVADSRLHGPLDEYRSRRFGGSFNQRENRCTEFDAVDFENRSHVPFSGWPIDRDILRPFYTRARRFCESSASAQSYDRDLELAQKPLIEQFGSSNFSANTIDRYGISTDFGSSYGNALRSAANICVLLNTTVTRLHLNSAGTVVDAVTARTLSGKSLSISATHVVLANGGLETPRLLLANRDVQRNGIGNDHDLVGRNYMCPVEGSIGRITLTRPALALWYGETGAESGLRSRRNLSLSPASQLQFQIGNFIARLRDPGPESDVGVLSRRYWQKRKENAYGLEFRAEQQPSSSSRLTLSDDRDALGMPRLMVDWNYNVTDFETIRRSLALFADDLQSAGVGIFQYDPATLISKMTCRGTHGHHHLGTARMGNDPDSSVVDANCRIHGMSNLYVAGSAIFPTSGATDPMLTLIALTLRLADHLKRVEFKVTTQAREPFRSADVDSQRNGPLLIDSH